MLTQFAKQYSIPLATTISAKGGISEEHELSLGIIGWVMHPYANKLVMEDDVDVMLCLGVQLNSAETMAGSKEFKAKTTIVSYPNFHNVFQNIDYQYEVLGDSYSFLAHTLQINDERSTKLLAGKQLCEKSLAEAKASCNNVNAYDVENTASGSKPIHPARLVKALRNVLPQGTVMAIDYGAHMMFAFHYWTVTYPTQVIIALDYMGSMGWAWGAVIGIK